MNLTSLIHPHGRIAKNTLLLYVRMAVVMVINLYAVRIVLQALGESDYGVYTAISGVVMMLSCVSTVLSMATQRFFSVEMQNGNPQRMKEIYSATMHILIGLSVLIIVVGESVGLWFIHTHLNIPADRMAAANVVYQCTLFTFLFTLFHIPFLAASIAHEDMQYFAILSTAECVLKLGAALLLGCLAWDRLSTYAALLAGIAAFVLVGYIVIAKRHYPECSYIPTRDKTLHKALITFSGWTLYGAVAGVMMIQAVTILTNIYFGTTVTASRAIALQIFTALTAFCNSFCMALRPPLMEAVATHNIFRTRKLFWYGSGFILVSMLCIAVPLIIFMRPILQLWLGTCNEDMVLFSRLIIIYSIIITLNNPITIWIQALGRVKEYHLPVETIMLLCFPITWGLYAQGYAASAAYWVMIGVAIVAHSIRLGILHHYSNVYHG